jgi:hypothetical protein
LVVDNGRIAVIAADPGVGAYARGLDATGLTFFDDEVTGAFGTNEEPMMCVAIGVDALRR